MGRHCSSCTCPVALNPGEDWLLLHHASYVRDIVLKKDGKLVNVQLARRAYLEPGLYQVQVEGERVKIGGGLWRRAIVEPRP